MPHAEPIYEMKLPVGINKQYLLSLIPIFGFIVSIVTCLKNIRQINRSEAFSWWIQSFLYILMYCLLLALIIGLCVAFLTGYAVLFPICLAVAAYICFVGMSFAMIHVEKKVIIKGYSKAAKEKFRDEQEEVK